ncbi:MAG: hypothetical protein MJ206_02285 [Bacilli bacterium]|nr:hypothetical protein [Bacilli bacterium]
MEKIRTPLDELTELLKNPPHYLSVDVYNERKKRMKRMGVKKKRKAKYTLNQLGSKIDQIGDALFEFIKTTNARFDLIEARLDYIVTANNLKDRK